jgi:hypothetical protein
MLALCTDCIRWRRVGRIVIAVASLSLSAARTADGREVYRTDFSRGVGPAWSHATVDRTPSGRRFLGQFTTEPVTLRLNDLPPHRRVVVSLDLFIIRSWDGNSAPHGPDIWRMKLVNGPTLFNASFSNTGGDGHTQSYPKPFERGDFAAQTGAGERNTLGYVFRGDTDAHDSVYRIRVAFPHRESSLFLEMRALGVLADPLDESWGLDNVRVSVDSETATLPAHPAMPPAPPPPAPRRQPAVPAPTPSYSRFPRQPQPAPAPTRGSPLGLFLSCGAIIALVLWERFGGRAPRR